MNHIVGWNIVDYHMCLRVCMRLKNKEGVSCERIICMPRVEAAKERGEGRRIKRRGTLEMTQSREEFTEPDPTPSPAAFLDTRALLRGGFPFPRTMTRETISLCALAPMSTALANRIFYFVQLSPI